MINIKKKNVLSFFVLLMVVSFIGASLVNASVDRKLDEKVRFGSDYAITLVDYETSSDNYMIVGKQVYFPAGENIDAGDSETAVDTATSYIDLSKSCILGEYASMPYQWSDYSYVVSSYSATEAEAGDTSADTVTDPSLSAGSTSTYISALISLETAQSDGGSASETVTWTANAWRDLDMDGSDDTATVPAEDYIPISKDIYIYFAGMVDSSDVGQTTWMDVSIGFYVDANTVYTVTIRLYGGDGDAQTYATDWDWSGSSAARLDVHEAEDEAFACVLKLSEIISDDSGDDPAIMGVDYVTMALGADDNYGSGTTDTITGYIYNLALFDKPPALTDNEPSTDLDDTLTGGNENAAHGDAIYFASHNILSSYWVAASDNDLDTLVYLDTDIISGQELVNEWHQIYFYGYAELLPTTYGSSMGFDSSGVYRSITCEFDFNKRKLSNTKEIISSTWASSYTNAYFRLKLKDTVFRGDDKEFHLDIIEATVDSIDQTDDFVNAMTGQSTDAEISAFTWDTAPTSGMEDITFKYYCIDEGRGFSVEGIIAFATGNFLLLGGLVLGFIILKRRR